MWEHKDYGHDYDAICIGYRSYKLQSDFDHFYIPIQSDLLCTYLK